MIKSLEALGYLNAKCDLEKQYPEQYQAIRNALDRLDKLTTFRKTTDISQKQENFAKRIAKDLDLHDFDITKFNKKSIKEFFDKYVPLWQDHMGFEKQEQETEVKDSDIPF